MKSMLEVLSKIHCKLGENVYGTKNGYYCILGRQLVVPLLGDGPYPGLGNLQPYS